MPKAGSPRARKHGHETHLVLVQTCSRCGRTVVLLGRAMSIAQFDGPTEAIAEARRAHEALSNHPDPEPLLLVAGPLGISDAAPPRIGRIGTDQADAGSSAQQPLDGAE